VLHALLLTTVLHVTIDLSIDQKRGTPYHKSLHVEQKGDGYVVEGVPVDASVVSRLADALAARPFATPTVDALGLDSGGAVRAAELHISSCSGVSLSEPAKSAYVNAFTDKGSIESSLAKYFQKPTAGNMPGLTVRIDSVTSAGEQVAESSSRLPGKIPWQLGRAPQIATYNSQISDAAGLVVAAAAQGLNDELLSYVALSLSERDWEDELAARACSPEVQHLAIEGYLPQTIAFVNQSGLTMDGSLGGSGSSLGLVATITPKTPKRIAMMFDADASQGDASVLAVTKENAATLERVARIPWIARMLAGDRGKVEISDPLLARSPLNLVFVDELREAGFAGAALRLRTELGAQGILWVPIDPIGTDVFLLKNDDVLIVDFKPSDSSLPFTADVNAKILSRARPWKVNPNVLVLGAIVHPDGTVDP